MAFEEIERVGTPPKSTIPADGVRVSSRAAAARGIPTRYIAVEIGPQLAKSLVLIGETTNLSVAFGTDDDAGKIAISVNTTAGGFTAKKSKNENYKFTINKATAEGLFAVEFPSFSVSPVEVHERKGQCPLAIFEASAEMLAVED